MMKLRQTLLNLIFVLLLLPLPPSFCAEQVLEFSLSQSEGTARYIEAISETDCIVTGFINSGKDRDLAVMRLTTSGGQFIPKWTYSYDGTGTGKNVHDYGYCARRLNDGLYLVVGAANSDNLEQDAGGDTLAILLKENESGNSVKELWKFVYNQHRGGAAFADFLDEHTFYLFGQRRNRETTKAQAMLMKISDNSNHTAVKMEWSKIYRPNEKYKNDYVSWFSGGRKTIIDGEPQLVGVGGSYIPGTPSLGGIYLAWIDQGGKIVKNFLLFDPDNNGANSYEGRFISEEINNGFVVTGFTVKPPRLEQAKDVFLLRIPHDWYPGMNSKDYWYREYGDSFIPGGKNYHDFGWAVKGYQANNKIYYALSGYTTVPNPIGGGGSRDLWLLCVDDKGNKIWEQHFGGKDSDCGYALDLFQVGNKVTYFLAGFKTNPQTRKENLYVISVKK